MNLISALDNLYTVKQINQTKLTFTLINPRNLPLINEYAYNYAGYILTSVQFFKNSAFIKKTDKYE